MIATLASDLRRTPYLEGGRRVGHGIDCLGVVLEVAACLGLPAPDPWPQIEIAWRAGRLESCTGFPAGWRRLVPPPRPADWRQGDVLLYYGSHPWSAIMWEGHVWSAQPHVGVYSRPVHRWRRTPAEHWRCG